jgi:CxxC motif-containing protein (DUF1111 family)
LSSSRLSRSLASGAIAVSVALASVGACSELATQAPQDGDVFDAPIDGLTQAELAAFARGDAEFERRFAPATGLGPIFNNASCASCHSGDGRGVLDNALQRVGDTTDEFLRPFGGPQIQDKAIPGAEAERVPDGAMVSLRLPPPVFGVGLIEAIPEETILAHADPNDANGDGISGRPNWVRAAPWVPANEPGAGEALRIGRFGRKAQTSNLLQQVTEAYHQDVGITSEFLPLENGNPLSSVPVEAIDQVPDPEIPAATVQAVTHYIRALAPPAPGEETSVRAEGRALFAQVKCASCHVPTMRTARSVLPALSNREVTLYSDLLLHDMGDALADRRPDGQATGREWKTPPLWGLRLMRRFLNGQSLLMHDGRARSVEDAIILHGGEAQRSRDLFSALTPAQRQALLDFVESR